MMKIWYHHCQIKSRYRKIGYFSKRLHVNGVILVIISCRLNTMPAIFGTSNEMKNRLNFNTNIKIQISRMNHMKII